MRTTRTALAALAALALAAAVVTPAAADDEGLIRYRQDVMRALGGHFGAIVQLAQGNGPQDQMDAHVNAFLDLTNMMEGAFKPQTKGKRTRARPEVWSDWKGFKARADDLGRLAADMQQAIQGGEKADIVAKITAVNESCKVCHASYLVKTTK